jgi:hypothetical protein
MTRSTHTPDRREPGVLARALYIWGLGRQISVTLAARLMAEGYDVPALEARHRA